MRTLDEDEFLIMVSEDSKQEFQKVMKGANKELDTATARFNKLDSVIQQLYEDKLEGLFNEERFNKLFPKYETEQKHLKLRLRSFKNS